MISLLLLVLGFVCPSFSSSFRCKGWLVGWLRFLFYEKQETLFHKVLFTFSSSVMNIYPPAHCRLSVPTANRKAACGNRPFEIKRKELILWE